MNDPRSHKRQFVAGAAGRESRRGTFKSEMRRFALVFGWRRSPET